MTDHTACAVWLRARSGRTDARVLCPNRTRRFLIMIMAAPGAFLLALLALVADFTTVSSAKQQLSLSDSYLPVAMQVIAHLTDQMSFETRDEPTKPPAKPTKPATTKPPAPATKPPLVLVTKPQKPAGSPSKPAGWTTARPSDQTTSFHRPGLYAPVAPPKPSDRIVQAYLQPMEDSTFTVISPQGTRTEDTFLSPEDEGIKPLVEPRPEKEQLLPPTAKQLKSEIFIDDELITDDELQYLSPELRDMIKMAYDDEERLLRADDKLNSAGKGKLTQGNLRLMLLYDLLSRDAKKQRLNEFSGFSASVMRELVESASGGARAQLSFALSKMLDRKDCTHDYANNRAKEMVAELARDEAALTNEVRYLRPLVYRD